MADSFDSIRKQIGEWLKGPYGQSLWDLITGLRGPDTPSERPDMSGEEANRAYQARRDRKHDTTEVIRAKAFFGVIGGQARSRTDVDYITLPPKSKWDHFDKHMARAAEIIEVGVKIRKEEKESFPIEPAQYERGSLAWAMRWEEWAKYFYCTVLVKEPAKTKFRIPRGVFKFPLKMCQYSRYLEQTKSWIIVDDGMEVEPGEGERQKFDE